MSLAAALVLAIAVSLVVWRPSSHAARGPGLPQQQRAALSELLGDAWVSNQKQGFFVEGAGGVNQTISLYGTGWWAHVAVETHASDSLTAAAVGRWLTPMLRGDNVELGDTAGMSEMERLQLAVSLARDERISYNRAELTTQIMNLKFGKEFRADSSTAAADLSHTAAAVLLLRMVGAPVPSDTAVWLRDQASSVLADRRSIDIASTIVPLLSVITVTQADRQAVQVQLEWLESQFPAMDARSAAAIAAALIPVAVAVGVAVDASDLRSICPRVSALLEGASAGSRDPHLLSDAITIGCPVNEDIPPSTRAGWPTPEALTTQLQASVDGLVVASALGRAQTYIPYVKAWLEIDHAVSAAPIASYDGLQTLVLRNRAGLPSEVAPIRRQLLETAARPDQRTVIPVLAEAWISGLYISDGSLDADSTSVTASNAVLGAVAEELGARITRSAEMHRQAVADTSRFALATGPYSMEGAQPSLWATILAYWISGKRLPLTALQQWGFCTHELDCYNSPDRVAGEKQPTLQIAAAVLGQAAPKRLSFPLAA